MGAQSEDGLLGREVLMDFRLVSQFLLTRQRWGDETKGENKHQIPNHTQALKKGHMTSSFTHYLSVYDTDSFNHFRGFPLISFFLTGS